MIPAGELPEATEAKKELAKTDVLMARGVEDLIDVLVSENILPENKIPTHLKSNIDKRKELRAKL